MTSDLRDFLPYSPESRAALTCVQHAGPRGRGDVYLRQVDMQGTARPHERRAFAEGEGVWWIRGHHDEQSPEGQALLAAYALDQCAA